MKDSFETFIDFLALQDISKERQGEKKLDDRRDYDYNFSFLQSHHTILILLIVILFLGLGGLLVGLSVLGI